MKNNKLNKNVNKVMTIGMAGAVALSAPLSLVYAAPSADDIHDYTDLHGFCDICGETKEDGNHYIIGDVEETPDIGGGDEIIEDVDDTSESIEDVDESTETESTETTETESTETEETDELFTANFYINKYTYKTDYDYIADKLEDKNMFDDYFSVSENGLKVRFNIYDKDKNLVDSFVIAEGEKLEKEVYKSYSYTAELISENIKNVDGFGDVICGYINNIPVLKKYTAKLCDNVSSKYVYENKEAHFDLCNEKIIKVDWTAPDFDLKALFENNQEAADFFFPKKTVNPDGTAHDKESCALQVPLPPMPELPDIPETSETTETTEETTESTETPSIEETTESTETPSTEETTESTETPSTEETTESTETPSTEETTESTETPSTEETTESTETPSTEETTESTETPSTEETTESTETPSTEETTESTETPSTEETTESTETPSTEETTESTETPSTEETTETTTTTTTEIVVPTPEPVNPVEPSTITETETTTTTDTLSPDRGKEEPSTNEIVKTGDMGTTANYGGYFLMAAMAVITPLIRKFKK